MANSLSLLSFISIYLAINADYYRECIITYRKSAPTLASPLHNCHYMFQPNHLLAVASSRDTATQPAATTPPKAGTTTMAKPPTPVSIKASSFTASTALFRMWSWMLLEITKSQSRFHKPLVRAAFCCCRKECHSEGLLCLSNYSHWRKPFC